MQKGRDASLRALASQLETHKTKILGAVDLAKASISSEQRSASRFFEPVIRAEMQKTYAEIAAMKGKRACFTTPSSTPSWPAPSP